jgi:hypothetical protein
LTKRRYYYIRETVIKRYKKLYAAAKARGESVCRQTGEEFLDLSDRNLWVQALSKDKLFVFDTRTNLSVTRIVPI